MGYVTSYTLTVEKHIDANQTQVLTLDEAMEKIQNMQQVNKDEIYQLLKKVRVGEQPINAEDIIATLREQNAEARYCLDEEGNTRESGKWYDNETQLKSFSSHYPGWLFTLHGEGEEAGDLWRCYFYEGKSQMAKAVLTYETFDKAKLK